MNLDQIHEQLKSVLSPSRYIHSVGVSEVSCDMAVIFGMDEKKAMLAGILHDCAKYLSDAELLKYCIDFRIPVSLTEQQCLHLLHGKVGAAFAKNRYGIKDKEILSAITWHTTGKPEMTLLEKIIFTADYIEPSRKPLPNITLIRETAYSDLDRAVEMILSNIINYLKESHYIIDMTTIDTYEYYKNR